MKLSSKWFIVSATCAGVGLVWFLSALVLDPKVFDWTSWGIVLTVVGAWSYTALMIGSGAQAVEDKEARK